MTATATLYDRLNALADPIRSRILLLLELHPLTVTELRSALQLPQSTVSRHLKVLTDEGWLSSRAEGPSNWYRMATRSLDPGARRLWKAVREQVAEMPASKQDLERVRSIVSARHSRSQEFFATRAGQWDRLRVELFGPGIEGLALAGLLDPSWVVADLGCGTGQLAGTIAPLVARVHAIDESAAMIRAAEERLRVADNVSVRVGSVEDVPLEAGSVDLAFAVLVLHHLTDAARAIASASRILKPGARLVVVDMMPHDRAEYHELMGHQWLGFDREMLERWCAESGLDRFSYRALPASPDAKGPLLFVATAVKSGFDD